MADNISLATEVAAVLEEFVAAQRAQAVGQARLQKIILARQIGEGQLQFEAVIEEGATAAEIYDMISRVESAADRLKAKVELSGHYGRMLNIAGQIEITIRKAAEDRVTFEAHNAAANAHRRIAVTMTKAQGAALEQHAANLKDCWQRIEETEKAIAECRRILEGEEPFSVLADQVGARLDKLRGARLEAAA